MMPTFKSAKTVLHSRGSQVRIKNDKKIQEKKTGDFNHLLQNQYSYSSISFKTSSEPEQSNFP